MFKQISESFNKFSSNIAYIYADNNNVWLSKTYEELKQEIEQIKPIFREVPKGAVIGVCLGKKQCLLPVICCLLELKIAFLLLEENENISDDIKLHSFITCTLHNNYFQLKQLIPSKTRRLTTKLGCYYNLILNKLKSVEEFEQSVNYNGICYIITTSGTMGRRKIVKVTENSIFSNIKSFIKLFNISNEDVIYFGTPLTFDPSLIELLLALTTGACLLATTAEIRNNPEKLLNAIFVSKTLNKSVTFLQMCPSVFTQFTKEQINFILFKSGLKILGLGGEPFPVHILPEKELKTCKVYNFYGITEVSCWASVHELLNDTEINLGLPLEDTLFQVKTFDGKCVNFDSKSDESYEGILQIGSKTRLCLIDDECLNNIVDNYIYRSTGDIVKVKNGNIYYIGRENDIIKRFGQRISMIKAQELIYNQTQLVNHCLFNEKHNKIICFIIITGLKDISNEYKVKTIDKIRVKLLKTSEPVFMPDVFEIIRKFEVKTQNGKLDTNILHKMADDLLEKSTEITKTLNINETFINLWCKYVGIAENLLTKDIYGLNFWESGGNSIKAIQFVQEYKNLTQITFNRALFDLKLQEVVCFITQNKETNAGTYETDRLESENVFEIIWKADMKACIDTTPIVGEINNRSFVAVGNFAHTFSVFHAESGEVFASFVLPNVVESEALVVGNNFYVSCFDGKLYCLQLQANEANGDDLAQRLECLWTFPTGDRIKNKAILVDDNIVFGSYDGFLYNITKDGIKNWKTQINEPLTAEMKQYKDKLYVGALKGSVFCLLGKTGVVLWTYKADYPIFTSPCLSIVNECVLFVDIQGNVYCFSLTNNKNFLQWIFSSKNHPDSSMKTFGSMTTKQNRIILGTENGNVNIYYFNQKQCVLENTITLNNSSSITTKPLCLTVNEKEYLLVVNSTGCIHLYLIETKNFSLEFIAVYFLPNECFSTPQKYIQHENRVYFGCRDNNLYCISINV